MRNGHQIATEIDTGWDEGGNCIFTYNLSRYGLSTIEISTY